MDFRIKAGGQVSLYCRSSEAEAVQIAVNNLKTDLKKVLPGIKILCREDAWEKLEAPAIVVQTLPGLNWDGHKEAYQIEVRDGTLYLTGADRRGTVYSVYTFCEWMGVSPWYFFADVPVHPKAELVLDEGYRKKDWPSVEYRGIFINDEEELEAWVQNYLGEPTIGVKAYEKIFELLLRLKGNYIWPAMHVNSFNMAPENGALADRMGIVVGTSHCDMLMRSNNREWLPWIQKKGYTGAAYDYSIEGRNREILKEYWRESVEQNQNYEVCYTLGMRGIHDSGFETKNLEGKGKEEILAAKSALLEKIITDQREILKNTLGRETMMTFIPYKEVLELYDNGLEIPEDMTLVWANDNYGYIRRYPSEKEKTRKGGNGIYFHNSYWSPPSMSYVFLCSIPLAHTRNELQKAWNEGIRKLWVLNAGAMKPLEQEITFFLRLAWEIDKPGALTENVENFVKDWINNTFTGEIGAKVSELLNDFSQLTNVRKVENMDYGAFSQTAYGDEAALRIHQYEKLFAKGNRLYEALPEDEKAAFFQLVLMRVHAAYFTNLAYYYGDRSTLMYDRGNMQAAAYYTQKSREAEDARRHMLHYYNHVMAGGKWNGMLNPEGFPPPRAAMMPVCTPPLKIGGKPSMRLDAWNDGKELCFVSPGEKWIDVGNTGRGEFELRVQAPEWVKVSELQTTVCTEKRITFHVSDVSQNRTGEILLENLSSGESRNIPVKIVNPDYSCAAEEDGIVILEAEMSGSEDFRYIPRLGRLRGGLMESAVQREPEDLADAYPLGYDFAVNSQGRFLLEIHRFPSLNSVGKIRVGVSLDGGPVQVVESPSNDEWRGNWRKNVLNNVDRLYLELPEIQPGKHHIDIWAVDRYLAFSRMVIYTEPRKENNLAGIRGPQPLPSEWDMGGWCDGFYGKAELPPRPVYYADFEKGGDTLGATCRTIQAEHYGTNVTPGWYLKQGNSLFGEENGAVSIDAAAVLAQSSFAWTQEPEKGLWRHCASESFGRSGLAMYIRKPELCWKPEDAPSLNYRILCNGGEYTVWMLSKFNVQDEGHFSMSVDGEIIPQEELYRKGGLWRYEAEQIYRWVPAAKVALEKGEHTLSVLALASGMRYDRFYLTTRDEQPPMDTEWRM